MADNSTRRNFLSVAGGSTVLALAGCISGGDNDGNQTGSGGDNGMDNGGAMGGATEGVVHPVDATATRSITPTSSKSPWSRSDHSFSGDTLGDTKQPRFCPDPNRSHRLRGEHSAQLNTDATPTLSERTRYHSATAS